MDSINYTKRLLNSILLDEDKAQQLITSFIIHIPKDIISGDFYETENNYKVLVYYRDLGARYDRIVGLGEGSSIQISN